MRASGRAGGVALLQRRLRAASLAPRRYLSAPNAFFRISLPVPTGSWRIFFSCSPITRYSPSSALPVT